MKKVRESKNKKTNPVYYVFCEGESEKAYINYLKKEYRKPITIKVKQKNEVNQDKINTHLKNELFDNKKDKIFLMYDLDVEDTLKKLQDIEYKKIQGKLLVSNPCFELWYLLHFQDQTANISSKHCENLLKEYLRNYQKGEVPQDIKNRIKNAGNLQKVIQKAKKLKYYKKPIYNSLFNNRSAPKIKASGFYKWQNRR